MRSFEQEVINPILTAIKNNQVYLTKPENLDQLAKLGYMYNTLWYAGRICYGSEGLIKKGWICEDNPKYKIEMCKPENEEIENFIYDAWGMHVSHEHGVTWKEFEQIVNRGKKLTALEMKLLKVDKTFDDWVEIKLDPKYQYKSIYPDRRSVIIHMLCCYGTGYGFKNGYIFKEASGADQDIALYGDWQNAKFLPSIQKVVDKVMSKPEVKEAVEKEYTYIRAIMQKNGPFGIEELLNKFVNSSAYKKMVKLLVKKEKKEKKPYSKVYPISAGYSPITSIDNTWHPSYIKAAIEICEDILAHEKEEEKGNVTFAKKFLKKIRVPA